MRFRFSLPARIPLFPLSGAVLMPREKLPLHVFEPKYLQLLEDTLKTDHRLIGMIQPIGEDLAKIGCAGRVTAFSEADDGRMMVSLRAVSRFRLTETEEGFAPYWQGRADWSGFEADLQGAESDPEMNRPVLLEKLRRYTDTKELSTDWDATKKATDERLINALSMMLPFSADEKQALLEALTLAERRLLFESIIEYALHGGGGEEHLQ